MALFDLPDRAALDALRRDADGVRPCAAMGFVRAVDDDRLFMLFLSTHGLASHVVARRDVPPALWPEAGDAAELDADALAAEPERATEWQLGFYGVRRLLSVPVPDLDVATRLWMGAASAAPFTSAQIAGAATVAVTGAGILTAQVPPEVQLERLQRLDRAAALVPSLLRVLDVRDVFSRLSDAARVSLPHDLLLLREFSADMTTARVYALSDRGPVAGPPVSHGYPTSVIRAWEYSIVDDLLAHPIEAEAPLTKLGARSVLRLSIKFEDRTIGGLAFLSFSPGMYASTDLLVGRRLADQVAVCLSHQELAEERRAAAALRERTANLEMLDGLIGTIAGVLDVREVFERVSAVAQAVLPHDGLSILELLEDGTGARVHASHGLGVVPEQVPMPVPALPDDQLVTRIVDDYQDHPEYARGPGVAAGMRSSLFVSIRLDDRTFGGLNFYSRTPRRFTKDDVLVARRVADHVALALSHGRLANQVRLTEELRARAANLDLLDAALASLIESQDLAAAFSQISDIAAKVLPHDEAVLMVRIGDGTQARTFARSSAAVPLPPVTPVPAELLADPEWEYHIFDDLATRPPYDGLVPMGLRSLMRVPIRIEGQFAGALVFFGGRPAAFTVADVAVARRIADRLAVSLVRDRELQAERRADEATERAARLEARVRALTDELDARTGYRRVIGESKSWRQVLTQATQVSATDTTALLLGESGTGKEVIARFIHRASPRGGGPFVALNCAALPEQLLEAELFGYERGAFTGAMTSKPGQLEQAAGGTLFLDEVGEMSPTAQAKFLRVLQEREFQRLGGTRVLRSEARIVAATNRDLPKAIAQNQFREDLYYRLNVFAIRLPALRDRRDDILPLADAFIAELGKGLGRPPAGISRDAREMLFAYSWPGNVRELRNALERAAILCEGGLITGDLLALAPTSAAPPASVSMPPPVPVAASAPEPLAAEPTPAAAAGPPASADDLAALEKGMIEQALATARFNKSKAAAALGMTRHQLYIRMRRHGLE